MHSNGNTQSLYVRMVNANVECLHLPFPQVILSFFCWKLFERVSPNERSKLRRVFPIFFYLRRFFIQFLFVRFFAYLSFPIYFFNLREKKLLKRSCFNEAMSSCWLNKQKKITWCECWPLHVLDEQTPVPGTFNCSCL